MNRSKVAVALLLGLFSCSAWAVRTCGEGGISARGVSPYEDPIENRGCALMGRVYCRIAEDRDAGQDQKYAVGETARWLSEFGQTGSHTTVNAESMLTNAGELIYRQKDVSPLSMFYQAVYACGAKLRIPTKDPQQQALAKQFGEASTKCQAQFPGTIGAVRNDPLRQCLRTALDRLPRK